jgi:hypothetical protein
VDDLFPHHLGLQSPWWWLTSSLFPALLLLGLVLPYAVLRFNEGRRGEPDPHLGLKAALHFAASLGILLALTGAALLVGEFLAHFLMPWGAAQSAWVGRGLPLFTEPVRAGAALATAGGLVWLAHLGLLLNFTNDSRRPEVRRLFTGGRFAIHGLILVTALALFLLGLFSGTSGLEALKFPFGVLGVWGPSWLLHLALVRHPTTRPLYAPPAVRLDEPDL